MDKDRVSSQFRQVIDRLIETGLSVSQSYPTEKVVVGGDFSIGELKGTSSSIELKDYDYADIYHSVAELRGFHIQLLDGGLIKMQYRFSPAGDLLKHRLIYYPSPKLPHYDACQDDYDGEQLYLDCMAKKTVRFPIRFDYDPSPNSFVNVTHPKSHLTLGQYENCRIPVTRPITPQQFVTFIIRNFYFQAYKRHKNTFDKAMPKVSTPKTITDDELKIMHICV